MKPFCCATHEAPTANGSVYGLYGYACPREVLIKNQPAWGQRTREALLEMNIQLGQLTGDDPTQIDGLRVTLVILLHRQRAVRYDPSKPYGHGREPHADQADNLRGAVAHEAFTQAEHSTDPASTAHGDEAHGGRLHVGPVQSEHQQQHSEELLDPSAQGLVSRLRPAPGRSRALPLPRPDRHVISGCANHA